LTDKVRFTETGTRILDSREEGYPPRKDRCEIVVQSNIRDIYGFNKQAILVPQCEKCGETGYISFPDDPSVNHDFNGPWRNRNGQLAKFEWDEPIYCPDCVSKWKKCSVEHCGEPLSPVQQDTGPWNNGDLEYEETACANGHTYGDIERHEKFHGWNADLKLSSNYSECGYTLNRSTQEGKVEHTSHPATWDMGPNIHGCCREPIACTRPYGHEGWKHEDYSHEKRCPGNSIDFHPDIDLGSYEWDKTDYERQQSLESQQRKKREQLRRDWETDLRLSSVELCGYRFDDAVRESFTDPQSKRILDSSSWVHPCCHEPYVCTLDPLHLENHSDESHVGKGVCPNTSPKEMKIYNSDYPFTWRLAPWEEQTRKSFKGWDSDLNL